MFDIKDIVYDEKSIGTTNPSWTKAKVGKFGNTIQRLADHICTRTPPRSYGNYPHLLGVIITRNQSALGGWLKGYELLTDSVNERLVFRDSGLGFTVKFMSRNYQDFMRLIRRACVEKGVARSSWAYPIEMLSPAHEDQLEQLQTICSALKSKDIKTILGFSLGEETCAFETYDYAMVVGWVRDWLHQASLHQMSQEK